MAGLIDSIFGGSVADVTRAREAETSRQIQKQLQEVSQYREPSVGERFGTSFGTAFGGKIADKVFGNKELEKAQRGETVFNDISNTYSQDNPEYFFALAEAARQEGKFDASMELFKQGTALATYQTKLKTDKTEKESSFGKEIFKLQVANELAYGGITPETFQAMKDSGLYSAENIKTIQGLVTQTPPTPKGKSAAEAGIATKPEAAAFKDIARIQELAQNKNAGVSARPQTPDQSLLSRGSAGVASGVSGAYDSTQDFFKRVFRPYE
tara:strand:+ start:1017 stop:1820 length:804 start_codon:yes stop_codon:yes gene_type:complete